MQDDVRHRDDPIPAQLALGTKMLDVPDGLIRIFDRDLVFASIARDEKRNGKEVVIKTDGRDRPVDIHALRHTFGIHFCRAGVPLRTAQAALRHSDPSLTVNVYTDPKLLDVAGAVEALLQLAICFQEGGPACAERYAQRPDSHRPAITTSNRDVCLSQARVQSPRRR